MNMLAAELNARIRREFSKTSSDLCNLSVENAYTLSYYDMSDESQKGSLFVLGDFFTVIGFFEKDNHMMISLGNTCDLGVNTLSLTLDVASTVFGSDFDKMMSRLSSEEISRNDIKMLAEDAPWS